ncbi:hypothetical protein FRC01_003188 [Tulasnella sp. 417]|nr:hypothetical protein FRC01_003188 [Tulasnella sp. 417]
MAGTFEGSKGIVKWAANIKTRLANDSTRHAFKELVQVQGFLFLEEYLEEVQRGPTQSLSMITEQEEEAERRPVTPLPPTKAKGSSRKPDVPVAPVENREMQVRSPPPPRSAAPSRAEERLTPSQIPRPVAAVDPAVRPSTPIRSPLARATSPLAYRYESGARSPSPTKVIKGTPGSPAFITRIPRSPKLGFQVGSAPLPNPPRSPLPLRKDLASSGPEATNSSSTGTSNPAASIRPSNGGEGALPPAPKVRSSFLQRHPHDGPSLLGGGKKSMGNALVGQHPKKSVAGSGALHTSTAGPSVTKWKADLELVERAEKPFKPTKSTYERESVTVSQRKRKSEAEDDESSGNAMRKSKVLKSSHAPPSRMIAEDLDSDDEYDADEFTKLRETVGNLKRQKSLHMVDIDITTRLNVKIPPPPSSAEPAPSSVPDRSSTGAGSYPPTQPSTERSSRSHERLSISELMGSTESLKSKDVQAPSTGKDSQPRTQPVPAVAPTLLAKKEFTLLMVSSNTSTTPPNSPPPSSLPPAAPQPPAKDSASGIKPAPPRPAAQGGAANAPLSQREATMLGVKPNAETVQKAESAVSAAPAPKVNPTSPVAARAPASKELPQEPPVTKAAPPARNFTEIPADLFMGPPQAPKLQPPAPAPVVRQSSVTTISTQASYTDSIFSTQGSHGATDTQPTEYGLSQEALPMHAEAKAKAKPQQPPLPALPKHIPRPESAMDEDDRAPTPASSVDDGSSSQGEFSAAAGTGLFAYASQFVSKAFGAGSAKKPKGDAPTKVFENAAAAKKEQEEKEKKAAERKEAMEARRLAFSQKKVEEDRARQLEQERKVKEEIERRKREREEMNASKLGAKSAKKASSIPGLRHRLMDEPEAKKRKITAEVERKPELKKQPSKDKLNSSFQAAGSSGLPRFNAGRPAPQPPSQPSSQQLGKTLVKKPSGNLASASNPYNQSAMPGPSFAKLPPAGGSKPFGTMQAPDAGPSKPIKTFTMPVKPKAPEAAPSSILKSAAGKARPPPSMQIALKNVVASEDIVLEEPNSEYSDSDDEGRNNGRPSWTQSPNLRQALEEQAHYNPDLIFGPIPQLNMGEMFPERKFRPRSSSANWEGHALSKEEQVKYNEKMGYMGNIAE